MPRPQAHPAAKKPAGAAVGHGPSMNLAGKVTPERRHWMIAEAAYYRAEQRHFEGGHPIQDWLDAETEINRLLNG